MKKLFLLCALIALMVLPSIAYSATIWYMPEGCTRGFDLWVLVTNPNSSAANITYTFYTANNGTFTHTETIAANARLSIHVNAKINAAAGTTIEDDVSTKVECTNGLNVYAERAMYWPQGGSVSGTWVGGHTSRAVSGGEGCYNEIGQPSSFPITISTSGSYKLISNIVCPDGYTAIEISTDNVTLDLNGFTISGPGNTGADQYCGIYVYTSGTTYKNITIKNGNIGGFENCGIYIDDIINFRLSNLNLYDNDDNGAYVSADSTNGNGIIEDCIFSGNGNGGDDAGLDVGGRALVRNNVMHHNNPYGIIVRSVYACVKSNYFHANTTTDIYQNFANADVVYLDNIAPGGSANYNSGTTKYDTDATGLTDRNATP